MRFYSTINALSHNQAYLQGSKLQSHWQAFIQFMRSGLADMTKYTECSH